jgi:hypothetical protein
MVKLKAGLKIMEIFGLSFLMEQATWYQLINLKLHSQ